VHHHQWRPPPAHEPAAERLQRWCVGTRPPGGYRKTRGPPAAATGSLTHSESPTPSQERGGGPRSAACAATGTGVSEHQSMPTLFSIEWPRAPQPATDVLQPGLRADQSCTLGAGRWEHPTASDEHHVGSSWLSSSGSHLPSSPASQACCAVPWSAGDSQPATLQLCWNLHGW
jgi:hypothetical protein